VRRVSLNILMRLKKMQEGKNVSGRTHSGTGKHRGCVMESAVNRGL